MDRHPTPATEGAPGTEAFALEALRVAVRRKGDGLAEQLPPVVPVHVVVAIPKQATVPDIWTAYAWGAAARLLGSVTDPSVVHAADVARARGEPSIAADLLAEGLDEPPADGPSGGDPDYLLSDFVVGGFLATLGRLPTADDLEGHVELLRSGLTPSAALDALVRSEESRRAFLHPRPWWLYMDAPDDRSSPEASSLAARVRNVLAPLPAAERVDELAARLDAIAESQWLLSREILDRLSDVAATRAPSTTAPTRPARAARGTGPEGTDGVQCFAVAAATAAAVVQVVEAHGVVVVRMTQLAVTTAADAADPDLQLLVGLQVLPLGVRRLGELAAALAPDGWTVDVHPLDRPAEVDTRDVLILTRTLTA